jgi:NADH-quinone oxidoreductase subunit L
MVMVGPLVILAVFAFGFGLAAQGGFYSYLDSNFEHYDINFNELAAIGSHPTEEKVLAGEPATEPYVSEKGETAATEAEAEPAEPWYIQILPIIVAIGGILTAGLFYWDKIKKFDASQVTGDKDPIRRMLLKGYYQHEIMTGWFAEGVVYGTSLVCNTIDIKLVDGWLNWLSAWVMGFAQNVRKVQTGVVQNYVTALVLGVVMLAVVITLAKEVGLA